MAKAKRGDTVETVKDVADRQAPRASGSGAEIVHIDSGEQFEAAADSLVGNVIVAATTDDGIDVFPTLWRGEWRRISGT